MYCPVLYVYGCWEKCHLHFGVGFEQWGRFHELYSVVSLTLGNRSQFQLFLDCKLWMIDEVFLVLKETFGPWGLGVTRWLGRCARMHVFLCVSIGLLVSVAGSVCRHFFFFYNLTSFIFSCCGITIGCWSVSLTQMGDKDPVCHGRAESLLLHTTRVKRTLYFIDKAGPH